VSLGSTLETLAGGYLASGAVRVEVKTNLGPAFTVYSGSSGEPGLADALGFKAAVVIRGRDGQPLASYGEPPATEPLLVIAYALAFAIVAAAVVAVIRRV